MSSSHAHVLFTDDDDLVVSGWGEVDDMREDLLKDWGELLEKWDGRDKVRPSRLINLCRKVSSTYIHTLHVQMYSVYMYLDNVFAYDWFSLIFAHLELPRAAGFV